MHPSYVYGAKIFPDSSSAHSNRPQLIATACFDQLIRLWVVPIEKGNEKIISKPIRTLSVLDKP